MYPSFLSVNGKEPQKRVHGVLHTMQERISTVHDKFTVCTCVELSRNSGVIGYYHIASMHDDIQCITRSGSDVNIVDINNCMW